MGSERLFCVCVWRFFFLIAHLHEAYLIHQGAFLDAFDERVSRSVIGDGQTEGILLFVNFDLFDLTLPVDEDEILETYLAPEELRHVYFVSVQRAEQDL